MSKLTELLGSSFRFRSKLISQIFFILIKLAQRDLLAALRHRLSENAAARERMKEKQAAIEARKKECRRWDDLHELISSTNSKKYRNFAQGQRDRKSVV